MLVIHVYVCNDTYSIFQRRKSKKPSNDRPVVYVNETKTNLPYSPDYKYEEGSSEITRESSTHIYDVIL